MKPSYLATQAHSYNLLFRKSYVEWCRCLNSGLVVLLLIFISIHLQAQCSGYDYHYDDYDAEFRHPLDLDPDAIYYPRGESTISANKLVLEGKTLYITGDFVMATIGGMTFNNCTFLLGPGARIVHNVIPKGSWINRNDPPQFSTGDLIFNNCTFEACTSFMWWGILGTAALETRDIGGQQHFKEATTRLISCTVKDAYLGFLEDKIIGSNELVDNLFENCYVAMAYGQTDKIDDTRVNTILGGSLK